MTQVDTANLNRVLNAIQGKATGVDLPELVVHLNGLGFRDQAAIKACIWRLIDDHRVELTRERKLRAAHAGPAAL
jgi:hypothetical protein